MAKHDVAHTTNHFFGFLLPTPPVSLPKFPRLDFGLCPGFEILDGCPSALNGRNAGFETSADDLSLLVSERLA